MTRKIALLLIDLYRQALSPFLPSSCRFDPTCSAYSREAISKYGLLKGGFMAAKRLIKCHPFHPGGFDPVK
jgi:hypothetical protein